MTNERIIGCTVAAVYSPCKECRYKSSAVGCIQYRNRFEAIETMGVM